MPRPEAIAYLRTRPEVDKDRIAVMGPSRGGELSLLLGATFPEIKAVVGQVPSPLRWGGNVTDDGSANVPPAWTLKGNPLPFLSTTGDLVPFRLPDGRTAYRNRPGFETGMRDPVANQRAMSAIENTKGPILMLGGEDDQIWPSCDLIRIAMHRLQEKKHPYADRAICYPGAGHGVTAVPGWPTTELVAEHPKMHILVSMGGSAEANARGQRDSWTRTLQFLRTTFGCGTE